MMKMLLARRERRVLVAGGVLIIGMVALSRGIPAWTAWQHEARAAAAELAEEVARAEASVRGLEAMVDSLEARKERFVDLAPLLIGVKSPAAAASSLTLLINGVAQAAGVRVSAVRVGQDSTVDAVLRRVRVSAELEGDVRGIATLLSTLERGPTLLAIRELAITQPDPASPGDRPEALGVQLTVEGLAVNPAHRLGE